MISCNRSSPFLLMFHCLFFISLIRNISNIGIKHGVSCINIRQVPVGGVENRGRRPRFSTPPKGPGEC